MSVERDEPERVQQEFAKYLARLAHEPSLEAAATTPEGQLRAARDRAVEIFTRFPRLKLTQDQHEWFSGKLHPGLSEVAEKFANAMDARRDVCDCTGIFPLTLRRATAQKRALGRLASVADLFVAGGSNGAILCVAAQRAACDRVLDAARAGLRDADTLKWQRSDLKTNFQFIIDDRAARRAQERQARDALQALRGSGDPPQAQAQAEARARGPSGKKGRVPAGPRVRTGGAMPDGEQMQAILALDVAGINQDALALGRIAEILPVGALTASQKASYAALDGIGQASETRNVVSSLGFCPWLAERLGIAAGDIEGLIHRTNAYDGYEYLGQEMQQALTDAWLLSSAFIWYLVDQIMIPLERRIPDPATPKAEVEDLLDHFTPGLLLLDRVLRDPVEQKKEIEKHRARLKAELSDRLAQLEMDQVEMALRHGIPVEREAVLRAAKRHFEKNGGPPQGPVQGPSGGGQPFVIHDGGKPWVIK